MKTMFKIFEIEWNINKLERIIKRYQEELRLEVINIMVLREHSDVTIVGVIFEKSSEYEGQQNLKPDKYSYAKVEPGAH